MTGYQRSHLPQRIYIDADWPQEAICNQTDPEIFFPRKGEDHTANKAKHICRQCPVQTQCLDYALKHNEHYGIWGGYNDTERRTLKRQRRRESA